MLKYLMHTEVNKYTCNSPTHLTDVNILPCPFQICFQRENISGSWNTLSYTIPLSPFSGISKNPETDVHLLLGFTFHFIYIHKQYMKMFVLHLFYTNINLHFFHYAFELYSCRYMSL